VISLPSSWLKMTERIEYKLLSLTYKVLTATQPYSCMNSQLFGLVAACSRSYHSRSSSYTTFLLRINDCSFRYASPCLWNQLPASLHQPGLASCDCPFPLSLTSSSSDSPLSSSITPSVFHSRLKTYHCLTNTSLFFSQD